MEISEDSDFNINEMEVMQDYYHIFVTPQKIHSIDHSKIIETD